MTIKEFYEQLLIIQYYNAPRARAEIGLEGSVWQVTKEFIDSLQDKFELDQLSGGRMDMIGRLVGVNRIVPFVIAKRFFGFSDNPDSAGFANKFDPSWIGAPFFDARASAYTLTQLNDSDYLFLIKAKIAFNQVHGVLSGDVTNLQAVIGFLFPGAIVIDNKDMTLTLSLPFDVSLERLRIINNSGLIPSPQGVGYATIFQSIVSGTFGFSNNSNSLGFANKNDPSWIGGIFARKVSI